METIVDELRRNRESGARRLEGEYRAGLMTLARRFCSDEGDAEELVNRTFAAVVEGIDGYVEQSAFFGWMCQILSNLHAADVRRKSNRSESADPDAIAGAADADATERLFRDVDASLLRDAVETLPANMRETILLHYFLDMPVAKIARFLAIPSGTVLSRLHYARLALAGKLGAATRKPGARMVLLALLLAAGLAAGRALYTLGTAVLETRAESAVFESHAENAESAEPVSRAESAESAEPVSHAESAESAEPVPAVPEVSTVPFNPSTSSTPESPAMNAKSFLAASASLALAAGSAPAQNAVTPRYYVGDSLVAMYDAVCNATNAAGAFVHDNAATKWIDLSGNGRDFTVESGGSWTDTTFEFNGLSATLDPGFPYYFTQEVRCQLDSGRWVLFGAKDPNSEWLMQGLVSINGQTKQFQTAFDTSGNVNRYWLNASSFTPPFTTTVTYKNLGSGSLANYCNGAATPVLQNKNRWASDGRSAIGDRPTGGFAGKGRIQSIRLYSRVLTDAEIARNDLVDQVRFESAALPEPLEPAVSCAQVPGVGDAGGALVEISASSFGWLASSLSSARVECSATADFASPVSFPAVLAADGASGFAAISGFEPGATVHVRAVAANDLGTEGVSDAATVSALSSATVTPWGVSLDSAAADSSVSAALSVTVSFLPSGASCDLRAIVSDGSSTWTNAVASGLTAAGTFPCALTHLSPGTAYTVSILASCGGGAADATPPASFSTPAQTLPTAAYVQNGLILHLDAIENALDASGRPVHASNPTTWTDLTGKHALALGGSTMGSIAFGDAAVVFPASEAYVLASDAADVSDAVLGGTFTVEAALKLDRNATGDNQYAAYSIGSGSYTAPRTLCFDMRLSNGKRGCIQYNANAWKSSGVNFLNAYAGNSSTIAATYALAGGGSAGSDALAYHDGDYLQTIQNYGDYTTSSSIDKKLRVRHYGSGYAVTDYYAFRVYDRSLSAAEIATNAAVDAVRLFGLSAPAPIEPAVSFLPSDNGTAGEALLMWTVETCGWPSASLPSLALEYAASPDFAGATTVSLGTDIAAGSGSQVLAGLVPGQTYYARAQAVNGLGVASAPAAFTFRASTGEAPPPAFTVGAVSATASSASFPLALTGDGGAPCAGYAVVSHGGHVATNELFSGLSAPNSATLSIAGLLPSTAYAATVCVTNESGLAADPASISFSTRADDSFVNLYVTNGLIALFDGICNATNAAGVPCHADAPGGWTDLMGNFATADSGAVSYLSTGVVYAASSGAYTWCEDAARAADAILSGAFTVEALVGYEQTAGANDYWGLYSFGSGSSASPRLLTLDARFQNNAYGALHYNLSGWNNNVMMLSSGGFSRMATYTVAGGGAGAAGSLYIDAAYQRSVPNGGAYTTSSSIDKHFSIRRYGDKEDKALYHSFRIYDRTLSADEIAHNRAVDVARFLDPSSASLTIASATRDGDTLVVSLARTGATDAADIVLHAAATFGAYEASATGVAFAENSDTAALTVSLPAGTTYVRFSAGVLATETILVPDIATVAGVSVGAASVSDVAATAATVSASVVVPSSADPVTLYAAYGLAPDELVWTNALSGASATVAASGVASGALSGLLPNRTYYLRVFGVSGGETIDSPADALAVFTTPAGEGGAKLLGDTVTVTGQETGDVLTFSGTSTDAASVTVNGRAATIGQDGTWSVTFSDVAPGVATDYLVTARNAAGDLDALPVLTETTRAASALPASVPGVVSQRMLSVSSALAVHGANATAVRLLTGPSADALTNTLSTVIAAGDSPSFAFAWSAPTFGEMVFWAVEIENAATDPANGHWISRSDVGSFTTLDEATYTWRAVDGDWTGDWSDPAHWADDKGGDALGYPQTVDATARIDQGTVSVDGSYTIGWMRFGADGPVTITGDGTLAVTSGTYQNNWLLVPDGADVVFAGGVTAIFPTASFAISATSPSQTNYAARVAVARGASFRAADMVLSYGGIFEIDDATAQVDGVYLNHGASATDRNAFPATGGLLRLAGAAPSLTVAKNVRSYNTSGCTVGGAIEFSVPKGGYGTAPIAMTGTASGNTFCGDRNASANSVPIPVRLAADSPVYHAAGTTDATLATWRLAHTDGAALVSLVAPRAAEKDPDHRRLYLAADDLSLRLVYRGGGTLILIK